MKRPNGSIYLVGFMGSGKSSVGRELADEIGWKLVDTDELIQITDGRSIERIFEESGEDHFREVEQKVVRDVATRGDTVVATGGGLFLDAGNRRAIRRSGSSLWLDVSLEALHDRIGSGEGRPLWASKDDLSLRVLFEKRRATYALADHRLNATGGTPREIALEAVARLRQNPENPF